LRFFTLRATTSLKIQGAFIPRRVFTQAGPLPASRAAKKKKLSSLVQTYSLDHDKLPHNVAEVMDATA
jgi:hypothetical protein